ncbi:MAG: ABC transporter substrate-binding protein [Phycisphaeraceae bacterium]
MRLGVATQAPSALLFVAIAEDFFADQGLDVAVEHYLSGSLALAGLLDGEVDAVGVADIPIVLAAFERSDFAVVATIASARDEPAIVAHRERGIERPSDLRGKRIGTQKGSAVHFFLHRFLIHHGLLERDVEVMFLPPDELPRALSEGRIDAFCMREPFVGEALARLGDRAVVFDEEGMYLRPEYLVVSSTLLEEHPRAVERMLAGLVGAERFVRRHPDRARQVVAQASGFDEQLLAAEWDRLELDVHLDQWLFSSMEYQARWAVRVGLVESSATPNYREVLRIEPLEAVKPEAVTVIR